MAGRPAGSTNIQKLRDFISAKDKQKLVDKSLQKALAGDPLMLKFILEQIYGKAVQPLANDGDEAFKVQVIPILNNALLSNNKPKKDSGVTETA